MIRTLFLALLLAAALHEPTHPAELQVLAVDLRQAGAMVASEATRLDPQAPATDKIRRVSELALRFERLVPAFRREPARLVGDFRELLEAYDEARIQVDRSGSRELALRFQWIQMLVARMAMCFGDESVPQTDFTPGANLPRGEEQYTPEGLAGLATEVHILSNQILVRSPDGSPQARAAWDQLVEAAAALRAGQGQDLTQAWSRVQEAWLGALPLFFDLKPDERSFENYSLLLSNFVRLRAAFAQLEEE